MLVLQQIKLNCEFVEVLLSFFYKLHIKQDRQYFIPLKPIHWKFLEA